MPKTNPNGANQYQLDPRQKLCWDLYINPKSETFSNGYRSAIKAGYEEGTALQVTTLDWFVEKCRTLNMLDKAEKNIDKFLEMDEDTDTKLRVKSDITKFVAERVGKERYSSRSELTGKDGDKLIDLAGLLDRADGQERRADIEVPKESDTVRREDLGLDPAKDQE